MVAVPPRPTRSPGPPPKAAYYDKLSPEKRAVLRQAYVSAQGGLCYHCKTSLLDPPPAEITKFSLDTERFPESFFQHLIHLHHDHGTGLTLGAVHAYCNAVLWQYHGQ